MGRCIGLDVHRDFAQVAIWENGRVKDAGRVATSPERLREFAQTLRRTDRVALEATMNTAAIAGLLAERAGEVVVSNPFKTRVIAEAKIKTDKVDARVLAELLAADYLPSVWQGRRCDQGVAPPGRPALGVGSSTDPGEKPGAGHPGPEPAAPLPVRRSVRDQGETVAG